MCFSTSDEVDDAVEYDEDIEKEKGLSGKKRGRLARFLALSLHLRQEFVTNELDRVPLGSKTPTLRATKTLKFLQESGFKIEEIGQVVQLLIYPRYYLDWSYFIGSLITLNKLYQSISPLFTFFSEMMLEKH